MIKTIETLGSVPFLCNNCTRFQYVVASNKLCRKQQVSIRILFETMEPYRCAVLPTFRTFFASFSPQNSYHDGFQGHLYVTSYSRLTQY